MRRGVCFIGLSLWAASLGGCGGYYVLTTGDTVAPAGGEAVAVARLERNEIWMLALPVKTAAIRFSLEDQPDRAAYTDQIGYAGAPIAVPGSPGVYTLRVSHLDSEGEEVAADTPLYAWDPSLPVVAVDLDGLPRGAGAGAARQALQRLAAEGNILYLTRQSFPQPSRAHDLLRVAGYPDGPVLLWQQQRWHIVRNRWNVPQVVVESRLVSRLPELRDAFPRLSAGICTSSLAAKAFTAAGMRCVVVGPSWTSGPNVTHAASWAKLAEAMH